ncbi:MAG: energy transducer TonB, partial [Bacteroidota bacterium]
MKLNICMALMTILPLIAFSQKTEVDTSKYEINSVKEKGIKKGHNDPLQQILPQIFINIKYPFLALENEIQGVVRIQLSLNEDCEIEALNVVRGLGFGCDEAALKGIKQLVQQIKKHHPNS